MGYVSFREGIINFTTPKGTKRKNQQEKRRVLPHGLRTTTRWIAWSASGRCPDATDVDFFSTKQTLRIQVCPEKGMDTLHSYSKDGIGPVLVTS